MQAACLPVEQTGRSAWCRYKEGQYGNIYRDGKFEFDHWLRALWEYVLERGQQQRRLSGAYQGTSSSQSRVGVMLFNGAGAA